MADRFKFTKLGVGFYAVRVLRQFPAGGFGWSTSLGTVVSDGPKIWTAYDKDAVRVATFNRRADAAQALANHATNKEQSNG